MGVVGREAHSEALVIQWEVMVGGERDLPKWQRESSSTSVPFPDAWDVGHMRKERKGKV